MKIIVNDFSGHPFQADLSRYLAQSGHTVLHIHFESFETPKGSLTKLPTDPLSLDFLGISLRNGFAKHRFVKRVYQEILYAKEVNRLIDTHEPELILCSNNPLDAQRVIQNHCRTKGVKFVFWLQDIYSHGITSALERAYGWPGRCVGAYYAGIEKKLLRRSDTVIPISEAFLDQLEDWKIPSNKIEVINNWAPVRDLTPYPKNNSWAMRQGLANKFVILYTGTIGFKHNPEMLIAVANHFSGRENTEIVIVSEGPRANYIAQKATASRLQNVRVLPFQPIEQYSEILGTGDVLIAMIETDAADFSVPSKILSYMCSGRPIVLAAPDHNLAAKTINLSGAGRVCASNDAEAFCRNIDELMALPNTAKECGRRAREFAEKAFSIDKIGRKFERLLTDIVPSDRNSIERRSDAYK